MLSLCVVIDENLILYMIMANLLKVTLASLLRPINFSHAVSQRTLSHEPHYSQGRRKQRLSICTSVEKRQKLRFLIILKVSTFGLLNRYQQLVFAIFCATSTLYLLTFHANKFHVYAKREDITICYFINVTNKEIDLFTFRQIKKYEILYKSFKY